MRRQTRKTRDAFASVFTLTSRTPAGLDSATIDPQNPPDQGSKMSALRCGLFALVIGFLLSCGGGGDSTHVGPSALGTGASVAGTDGSANGIGGIAADDGSAASSGSA